MHQLLSPVLNRLVNEVLYQFYSDMGENYNGNVTVKLSDYIGNPIQRDQNIRENYREGLIPQEVAVKKINGITDSETAEYMSKLEKDRNRANDMFGGSEGFTDDIEEANLNGDDVEADSIKHPGADS